jgi:hypothetical protein
MTDAAHCRSPSAVLEVVTSGPAEVALTTSAATLESDAVRSWPFLCAPSGEGLQSATLQIYLRATLNPGKYLDRLLAGVKEAVESSSPGAIWFTRCTKV